MLHSDLIDLNFNESLTSQEDMKKIVNNIIKGKLPFNDILLYCGMTLYMKKKDLLGENVYQVLDAIFQAALENKRFYIARKCEQILYNIFEQDPKIMRNNYT